MKPSWTTKSLGEVCEIERGGSPRPIDSYLTTDKNGINWIKIGDTKGVTKYITKTEEKIRPEGAKRSRMVFEGDFILSNSMSFGRPYIMKTTGCIHDGWLVLRQPKVDQDYLYYVLGSDLVFSQFDRLAAGSTVRNLNIGLVKGVQIPVPPFAEQQRIVGILDEAFEGIATAKANAEKNLRNARALFESHLQSIFAQRVAGWAETTLGNTYDVRDGTHDSPKYHATGYPLITSKNLKREGLSFDDVKLISERDYQKINERSAVKKGDVLFAMIGTIGNPTLVTVEPNFAIKNVALFKIPSNQMGAFLRYYLASGLVISKMMAEAKGTTQKFVGLGYLRAFPINLPPLTVQLKIVKVLDGLSREVQRLESLYQRKLAELEALKKSLLHQAFTGQL